MKLNGNYSCVRAYIYMYIHIYRKKTNAQQVAFLKQIPKINIWNFHCK